MTEINLEGRFILLTGASQGLGFAIAETVVRRGASVFLCARTAQTLDEAADALRKKAGPGQIVAAAPCDVSDQQAVAVLADRVLEAFPHLDALINNAGILGPVGALSSGDLTSWKEAVSVNLFGPLHTVQAFLGHFKQRRYGKIVNLSGGGATAPLPCFSAYGASKAALVRLSETLAEEVLGLGIDINTVAPGALATRMTRQVIAAGADAAGEAYHAKMLTLMEAGGMSMTKAAALCAWLCSAASDGITGRLIAAQWDAWDQLAARRDQLAESDIYTLRRILPSDRGKDWED